MRLRRSYSTPSETRPATTLRATLNTSRSTPAPATASASGQRFAPSLPMSSTVRPTRYGTSTLTPIAAAARTNDRITPRAVRAEESE